jgi:hypothetical protein
MIKARLNKDYRMPKFAVYYVPEEGDELYRLGSSVVGYDIRKRETVQTLGELQHISSFTDHWVQKARPYGFHLTIGDSIDFEFGKIAKIEKSQIERHRRLALVTDFWR